MWEGSTYEDSLALLKHSGVFPPCTSGLTDAAEYDLRRLIEYAFARIGCMRIGRQVARQTLLRIKEEHASPYLVKYGKVWAQWEGNLQFLQWCICRELERHLEPSATKAHVEADVIDYLTMELTGREFVAP